MTRSPLTYMRGTKDMFNFYDFEVFAYDWLVVIKNPTEKTTIRISNNRDELMEYYEKHKGEIWIGYNSKQYDQYILKSIILGLNPKHVNDDIIINGLKGFQISSLFKDIPLYNYDCMTSFHGLKQLEGFQGHNIHETGVAFDIDRPLTAEEIEETFRYCENDVSETMGVFAMRYKEYDAHMSLIKTFDLPLSSISKSKAQLSATILECTPRKFNDEWEIEIIDTLRISKYKYVVDWFLDKNNHSYDSVLETEIAGVKHVFAWGGLHGAIEKHHGTGLYLHVDVDSFYPALMIEYDLLSRAVRDKSKYKQIRDTRIKYKREKNPLQAPYKIVLNSTYGICKDKYSSAYDPKQANNVCVNGQLLLLDLIEHLEVVEGFQLIQSNTDGLIIKIPDTDQHFEQVDNICHEWETRCRMGLSFDIIKEIHQKDVNNYIFIQDDGKIERKGAYVKELSPLDNDLPIVNKALVDYMVNGTPVEKTILECNELLQFQKIFKVSSKYSHVEHFPTGRIDGKCHRIFATLDSRYGIPYKVKLDGSTAKVAGSPEHSYFMNEDITGLNVPTWLDKEWYITLAKKRLNDYGL